MKVGPAAGEGARLTVGRTPGLRPTAPSASELPRCIPCDPPYATDGLQRAGSLRVV